MTMALTDFAIVRRSLRSRMFSTCVTALTVAVAVALMLVLLSMRDAGRQAFQRGSGNMHLLVSRDQSPMVSVLNGVFYAAAPRSPILFSEYERIAEANPFDYAIPVQLGDSYRAQWPSVATTAEFFTGFAPAENTPWKFAAGRAFEKEFEVVLGSAVARATGHGLNDRIVLTHGIAQSRSSSDAEGGGGSAAPHEHSEFKYTVVGILAPTGSAHDRAVFTNLNSTWLIHAFDRREREEHAGGEHDHAADAHDDHDDHDDHDHDHGHGHDHDHEAPITLADLTPEDRKITNIYLRLPTRAGSAVSAAIGPVAASLVRDTSFNPPLTVASPSAEIGKLFVIVSNVDQLLLAMAAVVMGSSAISIMLALYNSLEQRRRQIAVLRVLGCSRPRIFGLLVTEATIIGFLGAGLGVLLAVAGSFVAAAALKQAIGLVVTPVFGLELTLAVITGAILLSAAAGIIPAIMAYRSSVADHLKPLG